MDLLVLGSLRPTWTGRVTWSTWIPGLLGSTRPTWPYWATWPHLAPLGLLGSLGPVAHWPLGAWLVSWLHLATGLTGRGSLPPLPPWVRWPLGPTAPGGLLPLLHTGLTGLYCPVPPGFTGAADPGGNWAPWPACALPQWPPLSSLSGRPAYWGSGHWPPWGLTGFLGSLAHWALLAHWAPWTCRLTGTGATESPCPWGGLRGQCPLARLGSLAALQRPLLHLARLGWRTGRLGRPSPARSGGRMHPHVASTVKSS